MSGADTAGNTDRGPVVAASDRGGAVDASVAPADSNGGGTLNFNVGVLGHVDSGKTSLSRALSTVASTACFDKNPQSRERGITIDLGFSSFSVECPDHLRGHGFDTVQLTLVDCPGHASLIRTIIGGAQIIDLMMLVVDVTKGMQTQTAECLVIGEITCSKIVVVLNKVDLLPAEKRESAVEKMKKRMRLTIGKTKFKEASIVAVAAKPGGGADADDGGEQTAIGVSALVDELKRLTFLPERNTKGPFLFAVDHCFGIRGQGTVMTGTVLQGSVSVNDSVEVCAIKETRKVKSMQMFRRAVASASQGDRVGLCVTQFDAKLLERGLVSSPGSVPTVHAVIVDLNKIAYYKTEIRSKSKFHISVGHETVLAQLTVFGYFADRPLDDGFSFDAEYKFMDRMFADGGGGGGGGDDGGGNGSEDGEVPPHRHFGLLEFDRPVSVVPGCAVLGSKLDLDVHTSACRLAFQGRLRYTFEDKNYAADELPKLKVFKYKTKEGVVERANNAYEVIAKSMFKKETNMQLFAGLKVRLSSGESGAIDGAFGQSGKFKIRLNEPLSEKSLSLSAERKRNRVKVLRRQNLFP